MRRANVLLLLAAAFAAACGDEPRNTSNLSNANMRGANTNTAYVVNTNTNAVPAMPRNATNISPPSLDTNTGNANNRNTNTRSNVNDNKNKKP